MFKLSSCFKKAGARQCRHQRWLWGNRATPVPLRRCTLHLARGGDTRGHTGWPYERGSDCPCGSRRAGASTEGKAAPKVSGALGLGKETDKQTQNVGVMRAGRRLGQSGRGRGWGWSRDGGVRGERAGDLGSWGARVQSQCDVDTAALSSPRIVPRAPSFSRQFIYSSPSPRPWQSQTIGPWVKLPFRNEPETNSPLRRLPTSVQLPRNRLFFPLIPKENNPALGLTTSLANLRRCSRPRAAGQEGGTEEAVPGPGEGKHPDREAS